MCYHVVVESGPGFLYASPAPLYTASWRNYVPRQYSFDIEYFVKFFEMVVALIDQMAHLGQRDTQKRKLNLSLNRELSRHVENMDRYS